MFWARLWARMLPQYLAALKAFASQSGVPLAEYVHGRVYDHSFERGAGLRERGAALRALINAGKRWLIAYHESVAIAGALRCLTAVPSNPHSEKPRVGLALLVCGVSVKGKRETVITVHVFVRLTALSNLGREAPNRACSVASRLVGAEYWDIAEGSRHYYLSRSLYVLVASVSLPMRATLDHRMQVLTSLFRRCRSSRASLLR
jgi:hypothetical protein